MDNQTKSVLHTAYAVLDAEGHWKKHKNFGFFLAYNTEQEARDGMVEHNGAEVIRVKVYADGDRDRETIALNQ